MWLVQPTLNKENGAYMRGSKLILLLGILSVIIPIIGVFLGLAAIGLGIKAGIKTKGNGRIQIRIGMVLGVISLVLTVVGLIFFLPMFIIF